MPAIYLIRHGQASFGKADYDQLSERGIQQAQLLGKFWRSCASVDRLYLGDLLRHSQTAEHFLGGYKASEVPTIIHSGFNELDHVDLLTCYNDQWQNFAQMTADINQLRDSATILEREFTAALNRWVFAGYGQQYKESWPKFKSRCVAALEQAVKQVVTLNKQQNQIKPLKDIVIFTSAGTISVILQQLLELSDIQTLKINKQLVNTGVTKLLCSETTISIDYINNYSHLQQAGADWVTLI